MTKSRHTDTDIPLRVDDYARGRLGMGSTGSGGRAPAWFDVLSRASGYPATEHARPEPFSARVVGVSRSAVPRDMRFFGLARCVR